MVIFYVVTYDKYYIELCETVDKNEYLQSSETVIDLLITLYRNNHVRNLKTYEVDLINKTIKQIKLELKNGNFKLLYE